MISCRLLGPPDLLDQNGRRLDVVLNQPKRFALFAYLAVEARGTPVQRDKLAALFWPELDQERARHALRQALHVLRRDVGENTVSTLGSESVTIDPGGMACDVADFQECVRDSRLEEALARYRGDFLDAFFISEARAFETWMERKRSDLRDAAVDAAMRLGRDARERREAERAVKWFRTALTFAPAHETALRDLVAVLHAIGNRAQAIAVYDEFAARLRDEYELEPDTDTHAVMEQIRAPPRYSGVSAVASRIVSAAHNWSGEGRVPASNAALRRPVRFRLAVAVVVSALLLAAVVAGAAGAARFVWSRGPNTIPSNLASVAVLPFVDISPGHDQGYIADGLTEELITALSKVPSLRVPARTSSFAFKDRKKKVEEIARELGVSAVLEGSVRQSGNRLRITAQLIDAATGYHLWSESYDRGVIDVFAVQEEIARAIVNALKLELIGHGPGTGPARLVERATASAAAYDNYLKGLYFWNQRSANGLSKAIANFGEAIDQDPKYAMAYAGLANAYPLAPHYDLMWPNEAFPKARDAAMRALQLDPSLADAHAALGYIKIHWDRDWVGAESELRRAIALNPGYATAYQWLRLLLLTVGRYDEAIEAGKKSQRLDPLSISIQAGLADAYMYTRRYREANEALRAALELDPRFARAHVSLCQSYLALGEKREAVRACEDAMRYAPENRRYSAIVAFTYARVGRRAQTDSILEVFRDNAKSRYVPAYAFALVHAGLRHKDSAFHWINRAVDEHDNWAAFIAVEPSFDELRDDPRFARVLERMRLPLSRTGGSAQTSRN